MLSGLFLELVNFISRRSIRFTGWCHERVIGEGLMRFVACFLGMTPVVF